MSNSYAFRKPVRTTKKFVTGIEVDPATQELKLLYPDGDGQRIERVALPGTSLPTDIATSNGNVYSSGTQPLVLAGPASAGVKVRSLTNPGDLNSYADLAHLTSTGIRLYKPIDASNSTFEVNGNARVYGQLTVDSLNSIGVSNVVNTNITTTDRFEITNLGTGPALKVTQSGAEPLAEFIDSEAGSSLLIANNGNTAIGHTDPSARVHIKQKTTSAAEPVLKVESSAGNSLIHVTNDGKVGVLTGNPGNFALDVNGNTNVTGAVSLSGTVVLDASRNLSNVASISSNGNIATTAGFQVGDTVVIDAARNITNVASVTASGLVKSVTGLRVGEMTVVDSFRNVANIGTVTAAGNVKTTGGGYFIGDTPVIDSTRNIANVDTLSANTVTTSGNVKTTAGGYLVGATTVIDSSRNIANTASVTTSGNIKTTAGSYQIGETTVIDASRNIANVNTVTTSGNVKTTSGGYLVGEMTVIDSSRNIANVNSLTTAGKVGIGKIAGSSKVDIVETGTDAALTVNQTGTGRILDLQDNGLPALVVNDGGNCGIGTAAPGHKLHVVGNAYVSGDYINLPMRNYNAAQLGVVAAGSTTKYRKIATTAEYSSSGLAGDLTIEGTMGGSYLNETLYINMSISFKSMSSPAVPIVRGTYYGAQNPANLTANDIVVYKEPFELGHTYHVYLKYRGVNKFDLNIGGRGTGIDIIEPVLSTETTTPPGEIVVSSALQSLGMYLVGDSASAKLGVGTNAPSAHLHVVESGTSTAALINQTGTGRILDVQDNGTPVFVVNDGGQCGIGTATPGHKLHVIGNAYVSGYYMNLPMRNYNAVQLGVYSAGASTQYRKIAMTLAYNSGGLAGDLTIEGTMGQSFSHQSLYINMSISFRSSAPTAPVPIVRGTYYGAQNPANLTANDITIYKETDDTFSIYIKYTGIQKFDLNIGGRGQGIDIIEPVLSTETNSPSGVVVVSSALQSLGMYLVGDSASAKLGVGTNAPSAHLHVVESGTSTAALINQTGTGRILDIQDNGTSVAVVNDGGNVGIGVSAPSQKLEVNGTVKATSVTDNNNKIMLVDKVDLYKRASGLGQYIGVQWLQAGQTTFNNTAEADQIYIPHKSDWLPNTAFYSVVKTLGAAVGDAIDICTLSATGGAYIAEVNIVQSITNNSNVKMYRIPIRYNITSNTWKRVLSLYNTTAYISNNFEVDIRVSNNTTTLRLVRTGAGAGVNGSDITCTVLVYQSAGSPVTFADSGTITVGATDTGIYSMTPATCLNSRFGVGVAAPTRTLHVVGNAQFGEESDAGLSSVVSIRASDNTHLGMVRTGAGSMMMYLNAAADLEFVTKAGLTTYPSITFSKGSLGIGTITPAKKLTVSADAGDGIQIGDVNDPNFGLRILRGTGDGATTTTYNGVIESWYGLAFRSNVNSNVSHVFDMRSGTTYIQGNLGLGTTAPTEKLHVAGNVALASIVDGDNLNTTTGIQFPPALMYANTSYLFGQKYIVQASSQRTTTGLAAFNAFNGITQSWNSVDNNYLSANNGVYVGTAGLVADYKGQWLTLQLPHKCILQSYAIEVYATQNFRVYGSNNGTDWTQLDEEIGYVSNTTVNLSNTTAYMYYGIVINKANPTLNYGRADLRNVRLYGIVQNAVGLAKDVGITGGNLLLSNGNLGVGTGTPSEKIEVAGNLKLNATAAKLYIGSTTNTTAGTIGAAGGTLHFGGTVGDTGYEHAVIEHRTIAVDNDAAELVIFKGNDINDQIRLRSGNIVFDTFPTFTSDRTATNTRMRINSTGTIDMLGDVTVTGKMITEQFYLIPLVAETAAVTVTSGLFSFRVPAAWTLTKIPRISVTTASTSGTVEVDVKIGVTSIFTGTTKLSIDANEKSSTTAAVVPTLATTSIADDTEILIDITAAGTGTKGLRIVFYYKLT